MKTMMIMMNTIMIMMKTMIIKEKLNYIKLKYKDKIIMASLEQLNEQTQNAQKKIIELKQKEAEEKDELEKKQTMFEPNIMVLQKWLDNVNYNKIQIEKAKNIKTKYDELMQEKQQDYIEVCKKNGSHPPNYNYSIDKKISRQYNKYWGPASVVEGKPNYIEDIETFEPIFKQFNDRNKGWGKYHPNL